MDELYGGGSSGDESDGGGLVPSRSAAEAVRHGPLQSCSGVEENSDSAEQDEADVQVDDGPAPLEEDDGDDSDDSDGAVFGNPADREQKAEEADAADHEAEHEFEYVSLDDIEVERERIKRRRLGLPGLADEQVVPDNGNDNAWDDEENHHNADRSFCFLCYTRQDAKAYRDNPRLQRLMRYYKENFATVSWTTMARSLQYYYNTALRKYVKLDDTHKVWRQETIIEHFTFHQPSQLTDAFTDLTRLRHLTRVASQTAVMVDPATGQMRLDATNTKMLLQLMSFRQKLSDQVDKHLHASHDAESAKRGVKRKR